MAKAEQLDPTAVGTTQADTNLQPGTDAAEQDTPSKRDAFQPILDDAIARIQIRAKQDQERGRDSNITKRWALDHVLPPLMETAKILDLDFSINWDAALGVTPNAR